DAAAVAVPRKDLRRFPRPLRPPRARRSAAVAEDGEVSAAVSSPAPSPASPRLRKPSRCASTTRSSNCPTATTARATTIRAPVTAGSAFLVSPLPSAGPGGRATPPAPPLEKKDPPPPPPRARRRPPH